jgi:biotin carboxyl carrier protein
LTFQIDVGGRSRTVEIRRTAGGVQALIDGREYPVHAARAGNAWSLLIGPAAGRLDGSHKAAAAAGSNLSQTGRSYEISIVEQAPGELMVYVNGQAVPVVVASHRRGARRGARGGDAHSGEGPQRIVAPMPGRVIKVLVKPGDTVAARQGLVIVEAMKMENELRSPRAGTVAEVRVTEGTSVEAKAVLIVVE